MLGEQQCTQHVDPWGIFEEKSVTQQSHRSSLDALEGPSYPVDLDDKRFQIPSSSSMERPDSPSESVSEESMSADSEDSFSDDDDDWQESYGIAQRVISIILKIIDDHKKATQFEGQQGNVREASGGGGEQADHPEDPPQDVEVPEDENDGDDGGDGGADDNVIDGGEEDDNVVDEDSDEYYDDVEDVPLDPEQGELEEEVNVDLNDHAAHINQRLGERFERMRRVAAGVLRIPEADLIDRLNHPRALQIQRVEVIAARPGVDFWEEEEGSDEDGDGQGDDVADEQLEALGQEEAAEQGEVEAEQEDQPADPVQLMPQQPSNRKRRHEPDDEDDPVF